MDTAEKIAQWVIDNRWPKSEMDKTSDFEMYHMIVESIKQVKPSVADLEQKNADWRKDNLGKTVALEEGSKECEKSILHSTDWNGKCFKCGEQVFVRDEKGVTPKSKQP